MQRRKPQRVESFLSPKIYKPIDRRRQLSWSNTSGLTVNICYFPIRLVARLKLIVTARSRLFFTLYASKIDRNLCFYINMRFICTPQGIRCVQRLYYPLTILECVFETTPWNVSYVRLINVTLCLNVYCSRYLLEKYLWWHRCIRLENVFNQNRIAFKFNYKSWRRY